MDFQPVFMAGYALRLVDKIWWNRKVRPSAVAAESAACAICGFVAEERRLIEADEVWVFPGAPRVELVDVRGLCTRCHEAKDFAVLLVLIESGTKRKERADEIRRHYCQVNECTEGVFNADFEQASLIKRALEEAYGMNCQPVVDYGRWGRPADFPRLTRDEQRVLRKVFEIHDEVFVGRRIRRTYSSAVTAIQATPLDQRAAIFREIESDLDDEDGDFEMFPDHECPWDINMLKD
jgi:hypothetical protein